MNILQALTDACEKLGAKHHAGPIWSHDAPYRETPSKVKYYLNKGVLGADMESSAMFSVAAHRGVSSGCILVASSNLQTAKCEIGLYSEDLSGSVARAVNCAVEAVRVVGGSGAMS
jgi:uridine phosphorylase